MPERWERFVSFLRLMAYLKGASVVDNSVVRALFLDQASDFAVAGETDGKIYKSRLSILLFVYISVALDFSVLLALNILFGRHVFINGSVIGDGIFTSIALSAVMLLLLNRNKLHRVEVIGDFSRFRARIQIVWPLIMLTVAVIEAAVIICWPSAAHPIWPHYCVWTGIWLTSGWATLMAARYALSQSFRYCVDLHVVSHKVVVVGTNELAEQFIARVQQDGLGVRVDGIFDETAEAGSACLLGGVPVRGNIDDLLAYNRNHDVDTVVIALPLQHNDGIRALVNRLTVQPLRVAMLPGMMAMEMSPDWCAPAGEVPGIHLMAIADLPIDRAGRMLKTACDKLVAAFALALFGPLLLLCALGIKLTSPGPVFYKQKRIGYRNRQFEVFKFRTMHVASCDTGLLTTRDDPRIFPFGQLLRRLSFDELAQLLNVLRGEMSLVGPRPHMPEARAAGELYFDAVASYAARHRVKPGITGWAQVNGWRGPTETLAQLENRVTHDLYYIDNWSFELDIKILFKTAFVGFFGKNAF